MNCVNCGKTLDPRDRFCSRCGATIQDAPDTAVFTSEELAAPINDFSNIKAHILLKRGIAFILDFGGYVSLLLVTILYIVGTDAVTYFERAADADPSATAQAYFVIFGIFIIYNAIFESIFLKGSIGKLILGLRVTSKRGLTTKMLFSVARNFLKLLPILLFPHAIWGLVVGSILFAASNMYPFLSPTGQTLPDLICGCIVKPRKMVSPAEFSERRASQANS